MRKEVKAKHTSYNRKQRSREVFCGTFCKSTPVGSKSVNDKIYNKKLEVRVRLGFPEAVW